jgi:hypothetical protein
VAEVGSNGIVEDKVGRTLQTMGELSGKVRSSVYQALVQQLQGLKLHSEHTVAQLTQLLDGVSFFFALLKFRSQAKNAMFFLL